MEGGGGSNPLDSLSRRKRNFSAFMAEGGDSSASASASTTAGRHMDLTSPPPYDDHYANEQPQRRARLALPSLTHRFPGDGFDFRRPATSTMGPVVDLTQEEEDDTDTSHNTSTNTSFRDTAAGPSRPSRMPRFSVNVIDDEDDVDGPGSRRPRQHEDQSAATSGSLPSFLSSFGGVARPQTREAERPLPRPQDPAQDEVELLFERPLPDHNRRPPRPPPSRSTTNQSMIDLTDDDDVVITDSRPRPGGLNAERPYVTGGVGTRSVQDRARGAMSTLGEYMGANVHTTALRIHERIARAGGAFSQIRALNEAFNAENRQRSHSAGPVRDPRRYPIMERRPPPRDYAQRTPFRHEVLIGLMPQTDVPGVLDFEMTGFNMDLAGENRPPTPKYSPPPEVGGGFTRSPDEDEAVVCPNCGSELSIGGSELRQQLWIIKSCGHAYCGRCAEHRGRSLVKKGKAAASDEVFPVPFKRCVVDGCGKPASKNSMIHVY